MKTYTLLDGTRLDLRELSPADHAFLRNLHRMVRQDILCFEIERVAIGPGSPALRGRQTVDRRTAGQPLYRVAEDIVDRAGIRQGLTLAPEFEHLQNQFPTDCSHISAVQAADLIGISRAAVYKAIHAGTLQALHIGNVTIVNKKSALEYRRLREEAAAAPARTGTRKPRTAHG